MKAVKTTKELDFTKTIVISFDVKPTSDDYIFGVGYSGGKLLFRGQKYSGELNPSISIADDKMEYPILDDENLIENLKLFSIGNDDLSSKSEYHENWYGDLFYDENKTILLDDGLRLYEETSDYSSEKDLIVEDNKVYKPSTNYNLISYVAKTVFNMDSFILKTDDRDDDVTFLSFGYSALRDLNSNSIQETSQEIIKKDGETEISSELSEDIFINQTKKIRFVLSNNGRSLNVSIYDKNKKCYIPHSSYSFIIPVEKDNLFVYYSSSSIISNVSTNF